MPSLFLIFAVGTGGFIGAISRYLASHAMLQYYGNEFPYGTLLVNALGSLIFGVLAGLGVVAGSWMGQPVSQELRLLVTTGFLGAFTTFSTFSYESIALMEQGFFLKAGLNISANILLSLALCGAGYRIMRSFA